MGKMGKGMETEFTKLCNTSGQESRQEWRTIIQRGKYTLGAWHRPTPRYQMGGGSRPMLEVRGLEGNYFQQSQVFRKHVQKAT